MSQYISKVIKYCRLSTNKKFNMAAGLIRNGKLVAVAPNGQSTSCHAETSAIKKYYEKRKESKKLWEIRNYCC